MSPRAACPFPGGGRPLTHLLLLCCAGSLACDADDADLGRFFAAAPYANSACNRVDQRLAGAREIRLYVHGSVDLESVSRGLARYFRRHGLEFFTQTPEQQTDMAYAVDTDRDGLARELERAFPGLDFDDEQALISDPVLWNRILGVTANYLLRPMVDFAREHGGVGPGVTNLVLIPDLERPGGEPLAGPGAALAGLAISAPLLAEFARTMSAEGDIWKGLELPASFTPVMVLGHNVLQKVTSANPDLRDLIVAHEFGHTGGLVHTMTARNLMYSSVRAGLDDCSDSLDDEQLGVLRATLGVGAEPGRALPAEQFADPAARPAFEPSRRFIPADLRAMMGGDRSSVQRLLAPLLDHPLAR